MSFLTLYIYINIENYISNTRIIKSPISMANDISPPPPGGMARKEKKVGGVPVTLVLGLAVGGVVLMLLGGWLGHTMDQIWKYPDGDDDKYDGDNNGFIDANKADDLDVDQDNWETRRTWDRALENVGVFFFITGIVLLIIGLLLGGILCQKLPDMVRLGMIVAVGFLVYYWV